MLFNVSGETVLDSDRSVPKRRKHIGTVTIHRRMILIRRWPRWCRETATQQFGIVHNLDDGDPLPETERIYDLEGNVDNFLTLLATIPDECEGLCLADGVDDDGTQYPNERTVLRVLARVGGAPHPPRTPHWLREAETIAFSPVATNTHVVASAMMEPPTEASLPEASPPAEAPAMMEPPTEASLPEASPPAEAPTADAPAPAEPPAATPEAFTPAPSPRGTHDATGRLFETTLRNSADGAILQRLQGVLPFDVMRHLATQRASVLTVEGKRITVYMSGRRVRIGPYTLQEFHAVHAMYRCDVGSGGMGPTRRDGALRRMTRRFERR